MAVAAVVLASLMLGATQSGSAQAQADFFRGKTLTMLIGYTSVVAMTSMHVCSRSTGAPHSGQSIDRAENMPGAGSLRAPTSSTTPPPGTA